MILFLTDTYAINTFVEHILNFINSNLSSLEVCLAVRLKDSNSTLVNTLLSKERIDSDARKDGDTSEKVKLLIRGDESITDP